MYRFAPLRPPKAFLDFVLVSQACEHRHKPPSDTHPRAGFSSLYSRTPATGRYESTSTSSPTAGWTWARPEGVYALALTPHCDLRLGGVKNTWVGQCKPDTGMLHDCDDTRTGLSWQSSVLSLIPSSSHTLSSIAGYSTRSCWVCNVHFPSHPCMLSLLALSCIFFCAETQAGFRSSRLLLHRCSAAHKSVRNHMIS